MDIKLQRQLAKEAGKPWEDEYTHHLGMVENPLPFGMFRTKKNLLDTNLEADPNGRDDWRDKTIHRLCLELGY